MILLYFANTLLKLIVEGAPTELGREEIESVIDADRSGMSGFGGGLKKDIKSIT